MPFGVALALVLLAVAPARAADPCLTGASTLGDQRALAALRADTDVDCPCASAASRGAYRRCAKAVLEASLDALTLRAECRKTALLDLKTATCGTTLVACGRVRQGATEDVASCKTKKATGCTDSNKFDATACTAQTHCSDVVTWSAGTCDDTRTTGPFAPGVRVVPLVRTSSLKYCQGGTGTCTAQPLGDGCACANDAACTSGVCQTEPRQLDTYVYYPAVPGSGPIDPGTESVLDAPLDPSGGPYPIVMFSHGSCGYANQSPFLWSAVASRGYVVVAPPHPGNTLFQFPACGTPQAQAASFAERSNDIEFALDAVLTQSSPGLAFLDGVVDGDRIAMTGHSFGGLTTFVVTAADPRIDVAVPMAPAVFNLPPLARPTLLMLGEIDSAVNNTAARALWEQGTAPRALVEILDAGHYAFSNACFPSPDCNPPTTLTQDEAHALVRRFVIPFLDIHLKGDATAAPFFAPPAPPGVDVTVVP